jgi:hypothetical protein
MALIRKTYTPCPVPADFDEVRFLRLSQGASGLSRHPAWRSFASGLNGIAFRFAAADEAHDRFVKAIGAVDAFRGDPFARYTQEESLASFFYNARSSLECFYFSMYCLGACLAAGQFPASTPKDLRSANIDTITKRFETAHPADPLTLMMMKVKASAELEAITEHRDALTHRGTMPRTQYYRATGPSAEVAVGFPERVTIPINPKDVPANWLVEQELGPAATEGARLWLGSTLNSLLVEGAGFEATHVPGAKDAQATPLTA